MQAIDFAIFVMCMCMVISINFLIYSLYLLYQEYKRRKEVEAIIEEALKYKE